MTHNITVESGTSVRLPTAGKYCDRDIVVTATGTESKKYKCELEYLESTGTQWIDTGIVGKDGVTTECSVYRTTTNSNECFCGAYGGSKRLWLVYTFGNNWYRGYNNAAGSMIASTPINEWVDIKVSTSDGAVTYNINGTDNRANYTQNFTTNNNVYLFAMSTDSGTNYWSKGRMSACKLYDGNVLVRDFIPVLDLNDVPCMYDKVSGEFFYNQGTGEFLYEAPPTIPDDAYDRGYADGYADGEESKNAIEDGLLAKTLSEYRNTRPVTIGNRFFSYFYNLVSVDLPNAVSVDQYAFVYCTSLQKIVLPSAETIGAFAFQDSSALTVVDLHKARALQSNVFTRTNLTTLILRKTDSITTNGSTAVFNSTPISRGEGFIYVPKALIETYKTATNWITYAAQIRAIEDYPEITGG